MKDENTTKEQLTGELTKLRQRIAKLEAAEAERKRMEATLQESEKRYRLLLESISDGVYALDREWRYTMVNDVAARFVQMPQENLLGKKITDLFPGIEETEFFKVYQHVMEAREPDVIINEYAFEDGRKGWYEVRVHPVPEGILCIATDVTQRKRAEEALRKREQEFKTLVENNPDMVARFDRRYRHIYVNPAVEKELGVPPQALLGKTHRELGMPAEQADWSEDIIRQVFESGQEQIFETVIPTSEGIKYYLTRVVPEFAEDGSVTSALFIHRNITEGKRAGEALQESEASYRELADSITDVFFAMDEDLRYTYWNKASEGLTGIAAEDAIGKSLYELFPDIRGTTVEELYLEVLRTQQPRTFVNEYQLGGKDFFFEISAYPSRSGISVFTKDITERVRAEEGQREALAKALQATHALRESEERLRTLQNAAPNGIVVIDVETHTIVDANPAAVEMIGASSERIIGSVCHNYICPAEKGRCPITDLGQTVDNSERVLLNADGESVPILKTVAPVMLDGHPHLLESFVDITERKRAEEGQRKALAEALRTTRALRAEKEKAQQYLDVAGVAFVALDRNGHITLVNKRGLELLGYQESELIGRNWFETCLPNRLRKRVHGVFKQLMAGEIEPVEYYENPVLTKDGAERIVAWHNSLLRDAAGNIVGTLSSGEDITERKQAGEALRQSEERLDLAVKAADLGLWDRNIQTGEVVRNERSAEIYGYSSLEEMEADVQFWESRIHPEDRPRVLESRDNHLKGVTPLYEAEYRLRIKSGEWRWILSRGKVVERDEDGNPLRLTGTLLDITDRKRTEQEREQLLTQVQEQARRVQQIVDTVPEGVLLLNADGQVMLANPVAEKDLVALANAKVGDTLTHLGDRRLAELLTSPPRGLWHEVTMDGRVFEVIARPMENGPEPEDWVLVIRDVTREREIEQRVQQQERLAAVGQLAAGIAHDFNNIMATIVLYAQMTARTKGLPATVLERMEIVNQQAEHATRLIQQILDFSRRAVLERRPLDLAPLLKEQIKLLKRTLPESIEIKLTYGPGEHIVNADPTRIQQVITNLAVNARDAMPAGGELRISLERIEIRPGESPPLPEMEAGEWIQVMVSDTGTGIPPDALSRIFEPFFTTRAPLGSGLGLAQVHGIVAQHEGAISVETQVDQGTTFTIYLPALPVHPPEPSTATSGEELPPLALGQGETILVVEDDAQVRKALVESLEGLNYRVLEAADGQKALAVLERHSDSIALLLSDVVMPGMGGIALLRALREQGLTVKVVMLTGHSLEEELESLRAQGMTDWLPKPPSLEQLAEVVARALKENSDARQYTSQRCT